LSFARAGAKVAAIDRDESGLQVTQAELRELGGDHVVRACDTSSAESVTSASEAIEKSLGPCSVLVNTAAILRSGGLDTLSVAERRTAVVPTRRIGMPQDIADAVLFLASDRSSYVNGDEITVDGGFTRTIMNLVPRPGHEEAKK